MNIGIIIGAGAMAAECLLYVCNEVQSSLAAQADRIVFAVIYFLGIVCRDFASFAWHPQISGVVTTLTQTVDHLRRMGHKVFTIHSGHSSTVPCPTYLLIRLAIKPWVSVFRIMDRFQPDALPCLRRTIFMEKKRRTVYS